VSSIVSNIIYIMIAHRIVCPLSRHERRPGMVPRPVFHIIGIPLRAARNID